MIFFPFSLARAVDAPPAQLVRAVFGRGAGAGQVFGIFFLNIHFGGVAMVTRGQQPLRNFDIDREVDDGVGRGDAHFFVLKVEQPVQKAVPVHGRSLEHWCTALLVV